MVETLRLIVEYRTDRSAISHQINNDQYAEYSAVCVLRGKSQANAPSHDAHINGKPHIPRLV